MDPTDWLSCTAENCLIISAAVTARPGVILLDLLSYLAFGHNVSPVAALPICEPGFSAVLFNKAEKPGSHIGKPGFSAVLFNKAAVFNGSCEHGFCVSTRFLMVSFSEFQAHCRSNRTLLYMTRNFCIPFLSNILVQELRNALYTKNIVLR